MSSRLITFVLYLWSFSCPVPYQDFLTVGGERLLGVLGCPGGKSLTVLNCRPKELSIIELTLVVCPNSNQLL